MQRILEWLRMLVACQMLHHQHVKRSIEDSTEHSIPIFLARLPRLPASCAKERWTNMSGAVEKVRKLAVDRHHQRPTNIRQATPHSMSSLKRTSHRWIAVMWRPCSVRPFVDESSHLPTCSA